MHHFEDWKVMAVKREFKNYGQAILFAMNLKERGGLSNKPSRTPMYDGIVDKPTRNVTAEITKRRAKNKVARKTRQLQRH